MPHCFTQRHPTIKSHWDAVIALIHFRLQVVRHAWNSARCLRASRPVSSPSLPSPFTTISRCNNLTPANLSSCVAVEISPCAMKAYVLTRLQSEGLDANAIEFAWQLLPSARNNTLKELSSACSLNPRRYHGGGGAKNAIWHPTDGSGKSRKLLSAFL